MEWFTFLLVITEPELARGRLIRMGIYVFIGVFIAACVISLFTGVKEYYAKKKMKKRVHFVEKKEKTDETENDWRHF